MTHKTIPICRLCLSLFFALSFIFPSFAQSSSNNENIVDIGAAIRLTFFFAPKNSSSFNVSASVSAQKNITELFFEEGLKTDFIPFWQMSINLYNNGLGVSLLPSQKRGELDIIQTLGFSWGMGQLEDTTRTAYDRPYYVHTFNQMTASSIQQKTYKVNPTFGTNILFNNHKRNQAIWFLNLGLWEFAQFTFYNDGPPIDKIGWGDGYDRWWTGGGSARINLGYIMEDLFCDDCYIKGGEKPWWLNTFNQLSYRYDRFTGNVQDAYVLSSYLFLNNVPSADFDKNFLNQGQTIFSLSNAFGFEMMLSYMGRRDLDIQDAIHDWMRVSHHFSLAKPRFQLGISYHTMLLNKTININE